MRKDKGWTPVGSLTSKKAKIQYFLFFLMFIMLFGVLSFQQIQATDDYELSIKTIDLKAPSNFSFLMKSRCESNGFLL